MALKTEEDSQNELATLREYLKRRRVIESEITILKEDIKTLDEEFKTKLDIKTVKLAIALTKTLDKVNHKYTFDLYADMIKNEDL